MAKRNAGSEDAYTVGFAKPPKSNQFKKGTSGNPKGRPKGSRNLATIVLHESRQPVRVNGPHGTRTVTRLEAAVMQLINKSAQGDLRASREVFALVKQAQETSTAQTSSEDLPEADQKTMQSILKRLRAIPSDTDSPEEDQ